MDNTWIEYKGKKILYTVYSHQSNEKMIEILKEQTEILKSNEKVLVLDDFRESYGSQEFMNALKEYSKETHGKILKNALLGISGIKKFLLRVYNAFAPTKAEPFNTKEEAMEYLVKEK